MTRPLAGRAILVTRPVHQADALAHAISAAGGEAVLFPALAIEAVPVAQLGPMIAAARAADAAVFVSPNAARFGLAALGAVPAARVFAVGPGTARALADAGVANAVVPDGQDSEALLALPELADVAGWRVVIVRGVGGRPLIADTLAARGARIDYLECYRRVRPQADATALLARWRAGGIDAVTVASAETLANLAALLGEAGAPLLVNTPLFAPHEKIAEAARRFGVARAIATAGGDAGLVDGMIHVFNPQTSR
jgi:uroporphyrinogen-III synthase